MGRRRGVAWIFVPAVAAAVVLSSVPSFSATSPADSRTVRSNGFGPRLIREGIAPVRSTPSWKLPIFVAAPAVIGIGSSGSHIEELQRRLTELHYDVGPIDGEFGYSTFHAVQAFQKVNGLARTGILSAATEAALDHPFIPAPRHGGSTHVEVDLTRQVVYYVSGGGIARILDASSGGGYTFEVDGVTKYAITPTGTYTIFQKIPGWWESPVGGMYDSNFFLPTFAIHGSASVPAYPASHGCIRVTVPAMDRLWPLLSVGMTVSLYY